MDDKAFTNCPTQNCNIVPLQTRDATYRICVDCGWTDQPEAARAPAPTQAHHAADMLAEAASIVDGARNNTHGAKERSFATIALFWNTYQTARKNPHAPLEGHDVAAMMALLKFGRALCGEPTRDHFVDAAGYAAISGELLFGETK